MKVWITRYALSDGILTGECESPSNEFPGMIQCDIAHSPDGKKHDFSMLGYFHGEGREWHRTELQAIHRAEEMRDKKLKSLLKQITKLQALSFR